MNRLYTELASDYHQLYQQIFNYQEQFEIFRDHLNRYACRKVAELGCGTGNLAVKFINEGFDYVGVDLAGEMITIARENNPQVTFFHQDMRFLKLNKVFDGICITGRSFTYLTSNEDVKLCLAAIHRHLKAKGILIFDCFLAEAIFREMKNEHEFITTIGDREYTIHNKSKPNLNTGWTWNWEARYTIRNTDGETIREVDDSSVLRAFTLDEIRLLLELNGFNVLESQTEGKWFLITAQKIIDSSK
jgi:SAM-dependent methyltransferase